MMTRFIMGLPSACRDIQGLKREARDWAVGRLIMVSPSACRYIQSLKREASDWTCGRFIMAGARAISMPAGGDRASRQPRPAGLDPFRPVRPAVGAGPGGGFLPGIGDHHLLDL